MTGTDDRLAIRIIAWRIGGAIRLITLLFTNDFHNHLNSAQSSYLSRLRSALGTNGLLLDAGDAVGSGNITFQPGGEPILRVMSEIGYDAMTVGNREFHISQIGFRCKVALARFPVLCANVRLQRQLKQMQEQPQYKEHESYNQEAVDASVPAQPYMVHDFDLTAGNRLAGDRFRVVVFGLTVPMVTERMLARKVSAYLFEDPLVTAARMVPSLQKEYRPDLVVALTHIGIAQDRKLAQNVPGIDLIIGGHTHVVLEHGEQVGHTLIAQAGSHGRFVGRVDIDFPDNSPVDASVVDASTESAVAVPYRLTASLTPLPKEPSEAFIGEQIESLPRPSS